MTLGNTSDNYGITLANTSLRKVVPQAKIILHTFFFPWIWSVISRSFCVNMYMGGSYNYVRPVGWNCAQLAKQTYNTPQSLNGWYVGTLGIVPTRFALQTSNAAERLYKYYSTHATNNPLSLNFDLASYAGCSQFQLTINNFPRLVDMRVWKNQLCASHNARIG